MPELQELNMDDIHDMMTDPGMRAEKQAEDTMPTGTYTAKPADRVAAFKQEEVDGDGASLGTERIFIRFGGNAKRADGSHAGRYSFMASPMKRHNKPDKNGRVRLDNASALWADILGAFKLDETTPVGMVVEAAKSYEFRVKIAQIFKTTEGWRTAKDADDAKQYIEQGFEPRSVVRSIYPAKA